MQLLYIQKVVLNFYFVIMDISFSNINIIEEKMITYRKATIDDLMELSQVRTEFMTELENENEEMQKKLTERNIEYFSKALVDGSFVAWIAVDDGKIVGTSGLVFYDVPPTFKCLDGKTAYIMNMYTKKDYRNQGIAKTLFSKIVNEAIERGYHKITLNATKQGRYVYEKFGFTDVEGDMVLYHRPE